MSCYGLAPVFAAAAWKNFKLGTGNGWMVSCMTGIPNCSVNLATGATALASAEVTACMADPRYMNWRIVTHMIMYNGTQTWYRTDSYWNWSSTMASCTYAGTKAGIKMSSHYESTTDNNGATNLGKTFVWAAADGSGVQLYHLSFATVAPSTNTTAGSGTNKLTTAPTSFTNSWPARVTDNRCTTSNLTLAGTTTTSSLSSTVTAYSDGYKATVTVAMENIQAGALGGWTGVCMVLYTSQYIQDNTNGAVCVAAVQSSGSGAGPTDFASTYLFHVPATAWTPPASSGAVAPASLALADAKYGVVYAPTSATSYLFTEGYYTSAAWYQPTYASTYTLVARYGKDNYAGAYCVKG